MANDRQNMVEVDEKIGSSGMYITTFFSLKKAVKKIKMCFNW